MDNIQPNMSTPPQQFYSPQRRTNTNAILGLVFAFIFFPLGDNF